MQEPEARVCSHSTSQSRRNRVWAEILVHIDFLSLACFYADYRLKSGRRALIFHQSCSTDQLSTMNRPGLSFSRPSLCPPDRAGYGNPSSLRSGVSFVSIIVKLHGAVWRAAGAWTHGSFLSWLQLQAHSQMDLPRRPQYPPQHHAKPLPRLCLKPPPDSDRPCQSPWLCR